MRGRHTRPCTAGDGGNRREGQRRPGGVLPGVTIVLTHESTGVFRELTSGADGSYFASQLTPGPYRLAAKLPSFRSFERRGLLLAVGKTLTINVTLSLGTVEETVQVTAESPLVDTTSAKVGGNIGTAELSELPAMNRDYFATVALLPGVQFSPSNQMGDTIVAAGQSTQGNNVAVDGGYNPDDALGWWHGNECWRAQGPKGKGFEVLGQQSQCPPQLDYFGFLAQASTESQGPWDSNYQIEDDYSWFFPGRKGDHDMKFGFRYNYTELRRVSQVNQNGTFRFNADLPFDPASPRTYPERAQLGVRLAFQSVCRLDERRL